MSEARTEARHESDPTPQQGCDRSPDLCQDVQDRLDAIHDKWGDERRRSSARRHPVVTYRRTRDPNSHRIALALRGGN
jgi:hypothetical protein